MYSLYIHIPFCRKKCFYCDFLSLRYNEEFVQNYVFSLLKEIKIYAEYFKNIKTVYFGGGTPSLLSENDLEKIFKTIYENFNVALCAEITVECNPETLSREKLRFLKEKGVNRLSIGVQTFKDKLLKILGREHTFCNIVEAITTSREVGFKNINIDLIFGIPYQSKKEFIEDLNLAISFLPEHLSIYNLTVEKNTKLYILNKNKETPFPSEEVQEDMYLSAVKICEEKKLFQYEISNFAKKGMECLHNLSYWNGEEYIGIGAGAFSYLNGMRYCNTRNVKHYIENLKKDYLPISDINPLTEEEKKREKIMLGLRKKTGIKIENNICNKFLSNAILNGLITIENSFIKLTPKGMFLSNYVIINLWEK